MKNNSKIVVIGSTNTDMVVRCPHMPRPGETVLGGEFMMNPGGKGANQAVAVAMLGGDVTFIGKVGDDVFGRQTFEQMKACGIDTSHLGVTKDCASGVALINVDANGENSISVASGANATLSTADIDAAEGLISQADIVLMQLETPLPTVTYAARMAKKHGVKVVLNPAPAPLLPLPEELLENVDIIIPNRTELETITEKQDLSEGVEKLRQKGISTLIVTLGSDGALVCNAEGVTNVPSFKVSAVDTTAAGDTFCGALCVALAEGKSISDAVIFGNKAAAISVTRVGAQRSVPTRHEVDNFNL